MALVNDPLFLVVATLNYAPCTRRAWRIKTYLLAARRLRGGIHLPPASVFISGSRRNIKTPAADSGPELNL